MNRSVFSGIGENGGIVVRILWTSLNQDGGVGFSRAMKTLISIVIGLLVCRILRFSESQCFSGEFGRTVRLK